MKNGSFCFGLCVLIAVLFTSATALAGGQVRALDITPFNMVIQDGRSVKVPYEGSVNYSGVTPFKISIPYQGAAEYSGEAKCSGETPFQGAGFLSEYVSYEGSVDHTYLAYEFAYDECFEAVGLANECPADRWTEYVSGKCPNECDYPEYATRCDEKKSWDYWHWVYTHRFFLENRENCCKKDGESGNWTCFGINPTEDPNMEDFCYPVYQEVEKTCKVPYSGNVLVEREVSCSGVTPFSGSGPFSGLAPFSGVSSWAGDVPYSGSVGYSGEADYLTPDSEAYPVTVTQACVGDSIDGVSATGWTWELRKVKYRIAVRYFKPGATTFKVIFKTETEKEVIDGEFTDSIDNGFTFESEGTYAFIFWVFKPDGTIGSVRNRVVAVTAECNPEVAAQ